MNSENIKQLIELFGNLGASSKEAFLWFLALDFAKFAISILMALTVAFMVYRLIRKCIGCEKHEKALKELRNHARLGSGYSLSDYEVEMVIDHYINKENK